MAYAIADGKELLVLLELNPAFAGRPCHRIEAPARRGPALPSDIFLNFSSIALWPAEASLPETTHRGETSITMGVYGLGLDRAW